MKSWLKTSRLLAKILKKYNCECYVVGGAVRDYLLNKEPKDIDLATSCKPQEITNIFKRARFKVIPTGIEHGTVTVMVGKEPIEITTYRGEGKYSDFRRPDEVIFVDSIEEDLSRRDLTINAMALDPITMEIVDPFGGQIDLESGIIRTVGKPVERFEEDLLRPFRAIRFASRMDFEIEPETYRQIKLLDKDIVRKYVSFERMRDELLKILESSRDPSIGIDMLRDTGLLEIILPEVVDEYGLSQPLQHHKRDVYYHTLAVLDNLPREKPFLRLAGLLHDIGKPKTVIMTNIGHTFPAHDKAGAEMIPFIARRLKLSKKQEKYLVKMVVSHMRRYESHWTDRAVRKFMRFFDSKEELEDSMVLQEADVKESMHYDESIKNLIELKQRIDLLERQMPSTTKLAITGRDILKLQPNKKAGAWVQEIKNYLTDKILENPALNNESDLIQLARKKLNV